MRETLARAVAVLTVACLVALSVAFAAAQNPRRTAESVRDDRQGIEVDRGQDTTSVDTVRARALFADLGCEGCHAVGGVGNPRNPLDGIGSRRSPASIRAWTVGEGVVADSISAAVLRVKRSYVDVAEADLELLTRWLARLKEGG